MPKLMPVWLLIGTFLPPFAFPFATITLLNLTNRCPKRCTIGLDALREIRSDTELRATPIVMLTSVTDIRMGTEAIESGANDYIAKPFQVSLLIERVERYIHAR